MRDLHSLNFRAGVWEDRRAPTGHGSLSWKLRAGGRLRLLVVCTLLLLPMMGLLFVIETMSVIIQIISFKTTGKRVFRMSPLHHHFELAEWSEVNIVIRFWIVAGIGVAVALGLFYADFLRAVS
jgi:UDP-N-acetylmuramyl pentapeptide phosphotransferase/UDP-N-acetylglucosamine-1-phosphate transferase